MNVLKQIVTKASLVTALLVVGLADLPANADSQTKKCTYGANNSVSCTTTGSSSTRSSTSSNNSRTTTNVDVNVSKKDVENILLRGIFGSSNKKPEQKHQFPKIPSLPSH